MLKPIRRLVAALSLAALLGSLAFAQVLVVAQGTDAVTLDPHDTTDSPSATVTSHLYETLFELTPEGAIEPRLATDYAFSEDGLTLTLTIRDGVTFHDGTPLTAEIVKGSLDRFLDPENAWTFRFLLDAVEEVAVTGDMQVELRLANAFAPLLAHLTHSSTAIVLPAAAERYGEEFAANPVGTGPFKFVAWQRNDAIELERFDGYWGEKPGVEGVRFLTVPENATRMAMVESGQAHVAVRVPPQDITRIDALPDVTVHNVSSVRTIFMFMNFALEPIDDVRVRKAINHAIDREALAEFVLGGAVRVSDAPIAPGIFGYTPVGTYEYDPELIPRTIDYYEQRTAHGSTLSRVVHSWVHARGDRERSWTQFCDALRSDVDDVQGGTTPEGIHLGAMAGTIDLLQRCYTGLELRGEVLHLNPALPDELGSLAFDIHFRGRAVRLEFGPDTARVSVDRAGDRPVTVDCRGEVVEVPAGGVVEFAL